MIFTFSFPVTLDLKFAHLVTIVQLCFHYIRSFYDFLVSRKLEAWDGQTVRQTDRRTAALNVAP